ncbi:MAG: nickel-responsive transcriptional regulator NikR [Geminicoccaceae bacterium]|nr:MAG: nickel-responsive transcriptional regulator NikR [Geminicoccaceae bacterium]
MQRITITIEDELLAWVDQVMRRRGYPSRSEAFRDLVRESLGREAAAADPERPCVATLTYVYDHERRDLARRLTHVQHHHHDLNVATLHVHLGHETCLEVAVLRGPSSSVQEAADAVVTQRGVRHGHLHVVPGSDVG